MTFWHWLSGVTPPPPKELTALEVIQNEQVRLHEEMDTFNAVTLVKSQAYMKLIEQLDKLNNELVRRSQQESKGTNV